MTEEITAEQTLSNIIDKAKALELQGNFEAAEQLFKSARLLTKTILGVKHLLYVDCLFHLAICNRGQGRTVCARELVIHCLKLINEMVEDVNHDWRWQTAFHLLAELSR
jgi:hypothetical protein